MDLANHPYRIAAYLFDFVLVVGAGLLSIPLNRTRHHGRPPKEASDDEDDVEEPADLTSEAAAVTLGFGSRQDN
jgi:hypothetical protein